MRAYAKINLGLQILGRREDGFHEIETILHPVDICDEISFENSEDICIECDQTDIPKDTANLCYRAADVLQQSLGIREGVRIRIKKRIPIGSGLGGGSSDAATVLKHLPHFWRVDVASSILRELAASLGSDVPYFLHFGTARATGRGEILEYFRCELPYWIVIVYPNIRIPTKWAYENFRAKPSISQIDLKKLLTESCTRANTLVDRLRNDLEPVVFGVHEAVARTKEVLYRIGAEFALMSGSGSSVFGLFKDEVTARNVVNHLKDQCQVFLSKPHFLPKDD